ESDSIIDFINDSYYNEYKELSDKSKLLDQRATLVLTISGLIMSALIFFSRDLKDKIGQDIKILIIISLVTLFFAFVFVIYSVILRKSSFPPLGSSIYEMSSELLKVNSGELEKRFYNFRNDLFGLWEIASTDLHDLILEKGNAILISQILVSVSILLVTISMALYFFWG
ncbi:MAG: hypothetical protein GX660_12250, partial [Clostridiaceae bacterium]|nr:hypothetical protein [Clostridiaceae bacterium]